GVRARGRRLFRGDGVEPPAHPGRAAFLPVRAAGGAAADPGEAAAARRGRLARAGQSRLLSRPRRGRDHAHRADPRADAHHRGPDLSELGLGLQSDKTAEEYVALARRAEAAGFDVISVFHDLLSQPAIYPLLLIAGATDRVRIGPAALNPSTLHPVELAGQAAALDLASRGRAYLGLVAGAWLDRLALDESRPVRRMREAVEIVRRLHAGDRSGFAGELFTLAPGAGLEYVPARNRVPLMIGTWKPQMAALAGETADEVKIGGCANPEMVRLMREWVGNDDVGIVVGAVTVVDEDGSAAGARAAGEVAGYLQVGGRR